MDAKLLEMLEQIAKAIAAQFGSNCEVVIHELSGKRAVAHFRAFYYKSQHRHGNRQRDDQNARNSCLFHFKRRLLFAQCSDFSARRQQHDRMFVQAFARKLAAHRAVVHHHRAIAQADNFLRFT